MSAHQVNALLGRPDSLVITDSAVPYVTAQAIHTIGFGWAAGTLVVRASRKGGSWPRVAPSTPQIMESPDVVRSIDRPLPNTPVSHAQWQRRKIWPLSGVSP